jgi:hypothetical protein
MRQGFVCSGPATSSSCCCCSLSLIFIFIQSLKWM